MFAVNYQTSPVKAKKLSECGFRGFTAHKRLNKWTAHRPEALSKVLQMVQQGNSFGDDREHLNILVLDRDILNKGSYNYG